MKTNNEIERVLAAHPPSMIDGLSAHRVEHDIQVRGGSLHIVEYMSREVSSRTPSRALWLLPGPIAKGSFFAIPHPGYHAAAPLLRAGLTCVTVDFLGTGASSPVADGRSATVQAQTEAIAEAIETFSSARGIAKIDLLGESWGGAVASQLAADSDRIRSCIIVSALFRTTTPALEVAARAPHVRGLLDSLPDGHLPVGLEIWGPLLAPCPPEVRAWGTESQLGRYPSAPMYAVLDLPYFDPSIARVPGLIVRGAEDPLFSAEDAQDLAASYGRSGAPLVTLPGAGHIPRIEEASREKFWSAVLEFLR